MKISTDITPVVSWQTKAATERCSATTWCPKMHDFVSREDPNTYSIIEAAHGLASVNTGLCAWCGGPIR